MWLIHTALLHVIYLLGGISLQGLIGISVVLIILVILFLLFIIIYLAHDRFLKKRKEALIFSFSGFISEIIMADTEEEKEEIMQTAEYTLLLNKWLKSKQAKNLLLTEIVKIHQSMSGVAALNLEWLYDRLQFQNITLKNLAFGKWHHKTIALQQLAQMNQLDLASVIFSHTNHKNKFIRDEAQLGMVKLTGFKGLDFLHIITYRISLWQQLGLLAQLPLQNNQPVWQNAELWLSSTNDTVVEFTLRLIQAYKNVEMHNFVVKCLQHKSSIIRKQTLLTLKEIGSNDTQRVLKKFYYTATIEEKVLILSCLQAIGSTELFPFLQSAANSKNAAIKNKAIEMMKAEQPELLYAGQPEWKPITKKEKQYASN